MTDVRGSTLEGSALLARLPGTALWRLTVRDTSPLTPSMRRLRFSAPGLSGLVHVPGQDLMFAVPAEGDRTFRRRYTIRRLERSAEPGRPEALLDIDIVLHGDGPGARWAAGIGPGDTVEAIGPRGSITLVPGADWHLFAADESGLPATFAMVEALEPGKRAIVLLEVDSPEDELPMAPRPGLDLDLRWLHRDGTAPGRSAVLADALGALTLPDGPGHAYLSGELAAVNALRAALRGRGLGPERLSAKPYWRLGVANAAQAEPTRRP